MKYPYRRNILIMLNSIVTETRRELLAKTMMDIAKIAIAGGFASEFFVKFNLLVRLFTGSGIVIVLVLGFFICPKKKKGDK